MTIKVGDKLPEGKVQEFIEVESAGCSIGPNTFSVQDLTRGKKIAIFGLPGAYTPTCSAKHVPGYITHYDALKAKGVDEIWCFSVNDAFVMGAWGRDQKVGSKIRMIADGAGAEVELQAQQARIGAGGLGVRCQRFSLLVDDGVVKILNVEKGGKYEVSDAKTLLGQIA